MKTILITLPIMFASQAFADFEDVLSRRAALGNQTERVTLTGAIKEIKANEYGDLKKRQFYLTHGKVEVRVEYYLSEHKKDYGNTFDCKEGDEVSVTGPLRVSVGSNFLGSMAIKEKQVLTCKAGAPKLAAASPAVSPSLTVHAAQPTKTSKVNADALFDATIEKVVWNLKAANDQEIALKKSPPALYAEYKTKLDHCSAAIVADIPTVVCKQTPNRDLDFSECPLCNEESLHKMLQYNLCLHFLTALVDCKTSPDPQCDAKERKKFAEIIEIAIKGKVKDCHEKRKSQLERLLKRENEKLKKLESEEHK